MSENLTQLNLLIRKEADDLLYRKGVFEILSKYGNVHISGSYSLDLMTWRDLDLYLETEHVTESAFFELGKELVNILHPIKMSYRNETGRKDKELPNGLYWGIYLGNERKGAWKIDVWAVSSNELQERLEYCEILKRKLTPENRSNILEIKYRCWQHPGYRRSFLSTDIYTAVLSDNVRGYEEFKEYLKLMSSKEEG
jgi:hypothetical protein